MVTSEGHWQIVDDRAKNVEADAEAPKDKDNVVEGIKGVAASFLERRIEEIDVGEGGDEVVATPVVRFGDLKSPPAASSTAGKAWYSFRPEHGLGPLIAGGWHHAQALWQSTGHRWPRGYTNLDDAVAGLLADWKDAKAEQIKISLGSATATCAAPSAKPSKPACSQAGTADRDAILLRRSRDPYILRHLGREDWRAFDT